MRTRPCMLCGEPLTTDDTCRTPDCAYNPDAEMGIHEAEHQYDEKLHQEQDLTDAEDLPDMGGEPDEFVSPHDTEDLDGDFEDEKQYDPQAEQKDAAEDADTMDISQDEMPDTDDDISREEREDMENEGKDLPKDEEQEQQEEEQEDENEGDLPEGLKDMLDDLFKDEPEQQPEGEKQLTREDKGEDPSDDAHDLPEAEQEQGEQGEDDPDLPPRPSGCNGDCQPGDLDDEGDPCPHCTAKSFKEEMEEQGKENQSPEQMEQDWQDFLDNWQEMAEQQGQGQGDQGDEQFDKQPEGEGEQQGEQKLEDHQPPDLDADDDDLPPKPQGCDGNCKPQDQYDMDADPCPHCTAKQFREEMKREQEEGQLSEDPMEIAERFQDFLKDWDKQQNEQKCGHNDTSLNDESLVVCNECGHVFEPEQNPEEIDEAPPEDELQDGMPKERELKKEREEGSEEFERLAGKMTVTQEKRFDNLMERIEKKVESTFGQTAEDIFVMKKTEGQFAGEEISQSIQITSRGVTFWVTLSAAKEI